MFIAFVLIFFGGSTAFVGFHHGGVGWICVAIGLPMLLLGLGVLKEEVFGTPFDKKIRRIEAEVARTRREIDRLESEAMSAINDAVIRARGRGYNL